MKIHEARYQKALDIAKIIFHNAPNLTFIGGTALNTFYLDYRYSEDIDVGYQGKNPKESIKIILEKERCIVKQTALEFRSILNVEGEEIKLDILEYTPILDPVCAKIDEVDVQTLSLEEFILSKTISFIAREELVSAARDAYDLYMIQKKQRNFFEILKKYRGRIRARVTMITYNFEQFERNPEVIEARMGPMLRIPVDYTKVKTNLGKIREVLFNE